MLGTLDDQYNRLQKDDLARQQSTRWALRNRFSRTMLLSTLVFTLFSPVFPLAAAAFSFTTSTSSPTQCGQVDVEWTGGTPPFRMLVMVRCGAV